MGTAMLTVTMADAVIIMDGAEGAVTITDGTGAAVTTSDGTKLRSVRSAAMPNLLRRYAAAVQPMGRAFQGARPVRPLSIVGNHQPRSISTAIRIRSEWFLAPSFCLSSEVVLATVL